MDYDAHRSGVLPQIKFYDQSEMCLYGHFSFCEVVVLGLCPHDAFIIGFGSTHSEG
jgi:hypothetical protein